MSLFSPENNLRSRDTANGDPIDGQQSEEPLSVCIPSPSNHGGAFLLMLSLIGAAVAHTAPAVSPPQMITHVRSIAATYDAFLLDQFGVLHDGQTALPGAIDCFEKLAKAGKRMVVLSNTSRRRSDALKKLPKLGFNPQYLTADEHGAPGFICSGEQAWQHLDAKRKGARLLWLGWEDSYLGFDNAGFLNGLDVTLAPEEHADAILAQGTQLIKDGGSSPRRHSLLTSGDIDSDLEAALGVCVERQIPLLCANPDYRATQPDGSVGTMPGVLADRYEALGGSVLHFGKPHAPAFDAACELLEGIPRSRVCHVGDSLAHDIAGANAAGVDSLFVSSGIHASALPPEGQATTMSEEVQSEIDLGYEKAVCALCEREAARPTYSIKRLVW
jgi:HAD superfamily hydrolase (TIGR01459 family)